MYKKTLSLTLLITILLNANSYPLGDPSPVEPILPEIPYSMNIRLSPSHAKVSIINNEIEYSDITHLKSGDYMIKITAEGYKEKIMNISVPHKNFPLILEREEATYTYKKMIERNDILYENHPFRKKYTWNEAEEYCANLTLGGYEDWRLPTREELRTIKNMDTYPIYADGISFVKWFEENDKDRERNSRGEAHFIDTKFIEEMPPFYPLFWTSEKKIFPKNIFNENKPKNFFWIVTFDYGYGGWSNKPNFVRCVRKKIKL